MNFVSDTGKTAHTNVATGKCVIMIRNNIEMQVSILTLW